jgi:hypothetical protein
VAQPENLSVLLLVVSHFDVDEAAVRPIDPGARRAVAAYGACLAPSFLTDFALPVSRYARALRQAQRGIDPGECTSTLGDARQALLKLLKSLRDALGDARSGNPLAFSFNRSTTMRRKFKPRESALERRADSVAGRLRAPSAWLPSRLEQASDSVLGPDRAAAMELGC